MSYADAGSPVDGGYDPTSLLAMDENCQYLNIWTQSLDPEAKKPVMVWLHGGGFFAGSSIEQVAYEGDHLSEYGDVVVVSLNHRLNILGYLDLSAYGGKNTTILLMWEMQIWSQPFIGFRTILLVLAEIQVM